MVIIFSSGIVDESTTEIIKYFKKDGVKFCKITPIGIAFNNEIEIIHDDIYINNSFSKSKLIIEEVKSVFLRKWDIEKEIDHYLASKKTDKNIHKIKSMYLSELESISNYIFFRLKKCRWFPDNNSLTSNKLIQSYQAKLVGFKTPNFTLSSCHKKINELNVSSNITKLINTHFLFPNANSKFYGYTTLLDIKTKSANFFPSYIQENIKKEFEIRTFYLDEKLYSFAIFSQKNIKTQNDFRQYDLVNSNRITPYNLNQSTTKKVIKMMKSLRLVTGSIDFIMALTGEIYFLEINPFGQFDSLSKDCNYYLEEKIALYLSN